MRIEIIINACFCLVITISLLSLYDVKASKNQSIYNKAFKFSLTDEYVSKNIGEFLNAEAQKRVDYGGCRSWSMYAYGRYRQ